MKINVIILLAILLTFGGCEWIKSLGEVDFDTDLIVNVPVTTAGKKSASADPAMQDVSFMGTATLSLEENEDISPYLKKLREIDLQTIEVTINGLVTGQTIINVELSVSGVGTICTQSNITSANSTFNPKINIDNLGKAAKKLKEDQSIMLTVSGTANVPIANIVSIIFGAKVTAGALD